MVSLALTILHMKLNSIILCAGTRVLVYGTAPSRPSNNGSAIPPSVSFALDGGSPVTIVSNPDLSDTEYAHRFYDSRNVSAGEHVLRIVVNYAADDWPFVLDYVQYMSLPPQPPLDGSNSTAVGLGTGTSVASRRLSAQAIVGAVVGGLALLAVAVVLRVLVVGRASRKWRKRPRTRVDLLDQGAFKFRSVVSQLELQCPYRFESRRYVEPKLPPPLLPFAPSTTEVESLVSSNGTACRCHSRSPSTGTELLFTPSSHHHGSDTDSHATSRPLIHRPSTPALSALGSRHPQIPSSSSSIFTRPGTPSSGHNHRPATPLTPPPAALHRPGTPQSPAIVWRPATPVSGATAPGASPPGLAAAAQTEMQRGPGPVVGAANRAIEKQAAEEARLLKLATFHADSGVRFDFKGDAVPPLSVPQPRAVAAATRRRVLVLAGVDSFGTDESGLEKRRRKEKRVSYGGSAVSEVPPVYTEE